MRKLSLFLSLVFVSNLYAQTPKNASASEIYHKLQKLQTVGSALYIAAHPDDENTRLISYLANDKKVETSYFSFTRGNGGQNLISEKLGDELGIIRTFELYNARNIDGGKQFFSTANDFGYSKLPYEAFDIWNKELVLDQLVYTIRKVQPDIIINRFDHRKEGITHGHHTASAQLSELAYDLAADPLYVTKAGPSEPWKVNALFFNVSYFFFGSKANFEKVDKSSYIPLNIGTYYPLLGYSNQEIASRSRSQHQSQGFGDLSARGTDIEYLEQIKGEKVSKEKANLFEHVNTSWSRMNASSEVEHLIKDLLTTFNFVQVDQNVFKLLSVYKAIEKLPDSYYKQIKKEETKQLILDCLGFYSEFSTSEKYWIEGSSEEIKYEFSNRSQLPIEISSIEILSQKSLLDITLDPLDTQINYIENISITTENNTSIDWLKKPKESFENQFINTNQIKFTLTISDVSLKLSDEIIYKYKDEVKGEIRQPISIIPQISIAFSEPTFYGNTSKPLISIRNYGSKINGSLLINENNKEISNKAVTIDALETKQIEFNTVHLGNNNYTASFVSDEKTFSEQIHWVEYNHIPTQYFKNQSSTKIIDISAVKTNPKSIGYIMGAGDELPKYLKQVGYNVDILEDKDITLSNLKKYKTIIVGIRAYNTRSVLKNAQNDIFNYIKNGGNWIVQYQTNHNLLVDQIAPFPLEISKDRITDEQAKVNFIDPTNSILNLPNKIDSTDFTNWTQEQGLYYAKNIKKPFVSILESKDPYDNNTQGALVSAKFGKGSFTYTGLSFFRQIPHGNIGAMKLLINLIENSNEK